MTAKQLKPDFYIYALVSTSEKVRGQNSLRVDVGTFDGLGKNIEYIGISRQKPEKRLSQHQSKPLFEKTTPPGRSSSGAYSRKRGRHL